MMYAIAGGYPMGIAQESLLEKITKRLKKIGRWFIDTLNQKGDPL